MKTWSSAVLTGVMLLPWLGFAEETPESKTPGELVAQQTAAPPPAAPGSSTETAVATSPSTGGPATAAPAAPKSGTAVLVNTPQQEAARTGLFINASLEQYVGSGTFVNPDSYGSVGASFLFAPTYNFSAGGLRLIASVRQSLDVQYLRPVGSVTGRRFSYSDTRLSLTAPVLLTEKFTGIAITPTMSATVPISFESRQASTITRMVASVRLTRSLGKFDLTYGLGGSRAFHTNPATVTTASMSNRDPQGNLVAICRGGQNFCASAGLNAAWALSNAFAVNFRATDRLWFQTSWDFVKSWAYPATFDPNDPYNSKAVDSNGNPVARVGWQPADEMGGTVSASWAFDHHFALSAGLSTRREPLTSNNQAFRFPFFDFLGPAESTTTYSVALQVSY